MAFTRDGRDFYKTSDGQLVSVEQGFDVSTAYQGLTPATKQDVDARDNERAAAPLQQDPRFDRDEQGYVNPDAAFGDVAPATPEQVAEFQTAEPEKPPAAQPFARDGREYYKRPDGSLVSLEAGFDPSEDYPNLVPATAEEVRKRDIQKRSGSLLDQVETAGHTAAASVVEAAAGVANFGQDMVDFFGVHEPIRGRDLVPNVGGEPLFYGKKELEQREANPTAAILGSAVPDYLVARYLPAGRAAEAAMAAEAARAASGARKVFSLIGPETTAARTLASSIMTEAGNAVIERDEFDLGRAFGVWAPTQIIFEGGLNTGAYALGRAFGAGKNAVNTLVERARTSAVDRALRETDPTKAAELLRKEAPAIYERAQATLDEALDAIDARLESSPDRLFTPGALKKTVSDNASAQVDAMAPVMARLRQAAEVVDSPAAAEAFDVLNKVRGWGGPAQFRAARDAWKVLVESGLDNPLIVEAREALAATLSDENVWGKAARHHANAVAEANRVAGPVAQRSVSDLASRASIEQRLEQARAMAKLTRDEQLAANVERAAAALAEADKATGARHLAGDLTNDEIAAMRKTLDAFPDKAPAIGEKMVGALDKLEEVAPEAFPETWTAERVERHIAERVAGSKEARKQLDEVIQGAEGWLKRAKASESASPAVIARATAEIERLRALADELDDVSKARKAVSDYDARPRGRAERLIDAATGKLASKAASKIGSTVAGAAAGYAQGGPIGAAIGGLAAQAVEGAVEPIVRERATKLGKWLKDTLRKHKGTAAGVAALYGANRLATDPNDPSPNAAAAAGLLGVGALIGGKAGARMLSGHLTEREILERLGPDLAEDEGRHLWALLRDAKVGRSPRGAEYQYDASKVGVTPDGRLVVLNKKGYAQGTGRLRYQGEIADEAPKATPSDAERDAASDAARKRIEGVQRGAGFGKGWPSLDTIEVDKKKLAALARKTGKAIGELPADEQLALLDYIEGGGASTFRGLQRGELPVAGKERYAQSLPAFERAIERLQRTDITEPLWRGFHVSPDDAAKLINSDVVETGALTSTSFEPFYAKDMFADTAAAKEAGHVPIVMKFENVERAAPISSAGFSQQYGTMEREAILPKNARFEVVNVAKKLWKYGGHIEVTLRQVAKDDPRKVGFVLAGLLGLDAATRDGNESGAAGAAVGGLALLYGGKGRLRLARELEHRAGARWSRALQPVVNALGGAQPTLEYVAKRGLWQESGAFARDVDRLKGDLATRAAQLAPNVPAADVRAFTDAWADRVLTEAAQGAQVETPVARNVRKLLAADRSGSAPKGRLFDEYGTPQQLVKLHEEAKAALERIPEGEIRDAAEVSTIAADVDLREQLAKAPNLLPDDDPTPWLDHYVDRAVASNVDDFNGQVTEDVRAYYFAKAKHALGSHIDYRRLTDAIESPATGGTGIGLRVREALRSFVGNDGGADYANAIREQFERAQKGTAAGSAHVDRYRNRMLSELTAAKVPNEYADAIVDDLIDAAKNGTPLGPALTDVVDALTAGAEHNYIPEEQHRRAVESFQRWAGDASKRYGLNIEKALRRYAGDFDYKYINEAARGRAESVYLDDAKDLQLALDAAVADGYTLPGETYRGVLLTDEQLARLRETDTVEAHGFMSTTADPKYAERFIKGKEQLKQNPELNQVVFTVRQRNGVPFNVDEDEVLLRAGTRFRIEPDPTSPTRFSLTEITDHAPKLPSAVNAKSALPWVAGGLAILGSAADDDETRVAAGAGGMALLLGKRGLGIWKVGREFVNLDHAVNPLAKLAEMGASPAVIKRVQSRLDASARPLVDVVIANDHHAAVAKQAESIWTGAERTAIDNYQWEGYRDVNEALREGASNEEATAIRSALDKAIAAGHTTPGVIWRGVDLDDKALEKLRESSHVVGQGVISAATNAERARVFAPGEYGKRPVLFRIEQETGVPVDVSGESEVLLRPDTKFEIVGIGRDRIEGGPYAKGPDDWRMIDVVDLREVGRASKRERSALPWIAGGAVTFGAALDDDLSFDPDAETALADHEQAQQIIEQATTQAAAIDEQREQQLDETRDKLGFLSHQAKQLLSTTARQLASPSREDRVAQRLPGVTNSAGVAQFLGNQKTMAAAYQDKRAALQRLQRDPVALVDEMTESLGELQQTAPELHAQVVQQTYKVAQYLQSKIPTTIGVDLTRPEGSPPNEYAVRQFALYYSAATDPSSVLTDLANNRARKEQVDTLRDVWPDTYTSLKVAVVEHLSRGKPTVNQRIRLNSLFDFGPNLDRALSPGLVAVLDGYRAKQGQQGAEKAAPERRTQPSIVGSSATPQLNLGAMGAPRAGLA